LRQRIIPAATIAHHFPGRGFDVDLTDTVCCSLLTAFGGTFDHDEWSLSAGPDKQLKFSKGHAEEMKKR